MTPYETLIAARALIALGKNWTQGEAARNQFGNPCEPRSPSAASFCSMGALERVSNRNGRSTVKLNGLCADAEKALIYLQQAVRLYSRNTNVGVFNDGHTHAEVMYVWDRAIDRAPGKPLIDSTTQSPL